MTIKQATALAQGAPLGGFTYHLIRLKVYNAEDIVVKLNGQVLQGVTELSYAIEGRVG